MEFGTKIPKTRYGIVKTILEKHSKARDNDRLLIWTYWMIQRNKTKDVPLTFEEYKTLDSPEDISRTRRKVQEEHEYLKASLGIRSQRLFKRKICRETKGSYVTK